MSLLSEHGEVQVHGIRQSEWIVTSGIPRSVAFQLFRVVGLAPEMRRPPQGGKPVAYLLPHHIEILQPLADRYRRGASMRQITEEFQRVRDAARASRLAGQHRRAQTVQDDGDRSETAPDCPTPSELARHHQGSLDLGSESGKPSTSTGAIEQQPRATPIEAQWIGAMVEPIARAVLSLRPEDGALHQPLAEARQLEEAARLAVPLSQSELAQLLGRKLATVEKWKQSRWLRPGILLDRHFDGTRVWWTVRRAGDTTTHQAFSPD